MKMGRVLLIFFFIFVAEVSIAEVYKWVDDKGGVHYTDDFNQIPEKNRPKIEKMKIMDEKINPKIGDDVSPPDRKADKKKEDIYRDRLGRGEDYWKGRIEEWKKRLAIADEKVQNMINKYNELNEKFNATESLSERSDLRRERDQIRNEMDLYRAQIEEAKKMLEKKIPEEAELFRAKPEWIKP